MRALFVTHPEVVVDPASPVTDWRLSDLGRARALAFARSPVVAGVDRLVASTERKAVETATILGEALGLPPATDAALGENDRSATGFLPPEEFERTADEFFARPAESVRGWETAAAAQRRVVAAVRRIAAAHPDESVVFLAHGAVGSLLLCDLLGVPVSRSLDQPRQGCWYAFDPATWVAESGWRPMPEAP